MKFHNGKELTSEDVKWSAEYALNPKNPGTGGRFLANLKSIHAPDRFTMEFVLKGPDAAFLATMASLEAFPITPVGSIPSESEKLAKFPPGTGPFVFKAWKEGSEIGFVANRNYWQKGLPYIDELVLKALPDDDVRFIGLRAGDVDIIERTPLAFVSKIIKGEYPQLGVAQAKYAQFARFIFNVKQPPLDNPKVRQALRHVLDKQELIRGAFWGLGVPTDQRDPKESQWYVELPKIERDPARAKALLREAGVGADFEVELLAER